MTAASSFGRNRAPVANPYGPLEVATAISALALMIAVTFGYLVVGTSVALVSDAVILLLGLISLAAILRNLPRNGINAPVLLIVLSLVFVVSIGSMLENEIELLNAVKLILPLPIAVAIIQFRALFKPSSIHYCVAGLLAFLLVWTLFQPTYFHESDFFANAASRRARLFPFFEQSPHSSGYVVAALLMILIATRPLQDRRPILLRAVTYGAAFIGVYLILGYRSTQVILTALAFGGAQVLASGAVPLIGRIAIGIGGILMAFYIIFDKVIHNTYLRGGSFDLERLGSGRFGTWIGRIELFLERSVSQMLFGTGPGSDTIQGAVWDKVTTAHNTFITYLMELGIIGLGLMLWYFFLLQSRFGVAMSGFLAAVITSALIGNGIALRPTVFVLFALAGALAVQRADLLGRNAKTLAGTSPKARNDARTKREVNGYTWRVS